MLEHFLDNINEGVTVNLVDPLMTVDGTLEPIEVITARMRMQFLRNQDLEGLPILDVRCTQLFHNLVRMTVVSPQQIKSLVQVHRREGFCTKYKDACR